MNPNTNTWTKTNIESNATNQMFSIDLGFKSNGYPITAYVTPSGATGFVKTAEYNGSNWTTTPIWTGRYTSFDLANMDFEYNSGENYYGLSFVDTYNYHPRKSGVYVTNKGGIIKKYNYPCSQTDTSFVNRLFFKKYKGEIIPFILQGYQASESPYYSTDFIYLQNEEFVTGQFLSYLRGSYYNFDVILV
jgi:hypothetical protein